MASTGSQFGWTQLWNTTQSALTNVMGAPACGAGAVYVAGSKSVVALDYESGNTIWTWTTPTEQFVSAPVQLYGDCVIAVSNTYLLSQSMICWIDAATGQTVRTATVQVEGQPTPNIGDFMISGSTLLIPADQNQLFAFDLDTGAQLWVTTLTGGAQTYGAIVTTPEVVGGFIFAGSAPGIAQNVNWAWMNVLDFDGNLLGSFNVHQAYGQTDATSFQSSTLLPSLSSTIPMVMFGYNNNATMAVSFDPATGAMANPWMVLNTQPIVNFEMSGTSAMSPVLSGELLYIFTWGQSGTSITALNALTGAAALKSVSEVQLNPGPVTVVPSANGFYMTIAQYLCAFSFDLRSATVTNVSQDLFFAPAEIDGVIYATTLTSGALSTYALQAVPDLSDQFYLDTRFMEAWSDGSRTYAYAYSVKVLGANGLPLPNEPLTIWTEP
jgi:hypothetical protein